MARNLKSCFALSICLFFLLPGFAYSEEKKSVSKDESSDKARIEKNNDALESSSDPVSDKNLKKTDPDSKSEAVDCKESWLNLLKNKPNHVRTDEKYAMTIIRPNPDIDPEIVVNVARPGTEYSMNIINPYTKRKAKGYAVPSFGLYPHKFQHKD